MRVPNGVGVEAWIFHSAVERVVCSVVGDEAISSESVAEVD